MGCCKQLLPFPERPVILHCLETIRSAGIDQIVLVLAEPYGAAIAQIVAPFSPQIAWNPDQGSDMAQSLRCGLSLLPADTTGVLVFVPDHPLVSPATCLELVVRHGSTPESILIPTFQGRKGHPVLLPAAIMHELGSHSSLRDLIATHGELVALLPTTDEGTVLDQDTPAAYEHNLARSIP